MSISTPRDTSRNNETRNQIAQPRPPVSVLIIMQQMITALTVEGRSNIEGIREAAPLAWIPSRGVTRPGPRPRNKYKSRLSKTMNPAQPTSQIPGDRAVISARTTPTSHLWILSVSGFKTDSCSVSLVPGSNTSASTLEEIYSQLILAFPESVHLPLTFIMAPHHTTHFTPEAELEKHFGTSCQYSVTGSRVRGLVRWYWKISSRKYDK